MKILVTNDDGVLSEGLWTLVKALRGIGQVVVVAPDREQSAIGTAVTLRQPLRVQKLTPPLPEVETYSVEGTPADSVILALDKLVEEKIDLVVAGVNQGPNLGDDVFISGTVSAARQGYLRGLPTLAISAFRTNNYSLNDAAQVAALLVGKISSHPQPHIMLNINLPDVPLAKIKGVKITRLASLSHVDAVEEGHDGIHAYYWLVRRRLISNAPGSTDIGAVERGNISITPLQNYYTNHKTPSPLMRDLCSSLSDELQKVAKNKKEGR